MANTKIKILRGLKKDLPLLDRGEIAFCTDTEELFAGDGEKNLLLSGGGEVDLNTIAYFNYASRIYGDKYSLLVSAWEHSLTVDPEEIGTAQYPNGETEGVIIPQGVTSIGDNAFGYQLSNNQPLVIPNSVTSIGNNAFGGWTSNNQPLVIPNSVTSIGNNAFAGWLSNNQPLVIPDSVTSIGNNAFLDWSLVPYVEMKATTPPSLASVEVFGNQNNAPIYVPDESVGAYKTATNWVDLADRIFPISDKADLMDDIEGLKLDVQTIEQSVEGLENNKVDKVQGKGLSTNDYTTTEKNKLAGIASGAEVNVQSDWNATSGDALILNKPIIPTKVSELINDKNYVDENYVNSKLTAVYKFKGSIANYAALPTTDLTIGDVYDVQDTGMNYAWNGSDWDSLGIVIDLSNYYQKNETFTQNEINSMLDDKVDKVSGKGLSTNDFTNNDKNKLDGIEVGAEVNPYSKTQLDNMFDDKVDKVSGMGLSSNDFTTTEKNKLSGIQAGAQVNAVTTVAGRTGAVVLSKADVGLGSVQNYGISSQAQAIAGTVNTVYMTPLRTKEAITAAMGDIESALDAILGV